VDVFGIETESVQKRFFNDSTVVKMLSRKGSAVNPKYEYLNPYPSVEGSSAISKKQNPKVLKTGLNTALRYGSPRCA
jgi:hypothetical protein